MNNFLSSRQLIELRFSSVSLERIKRILYIDLQKQESNYMRFFCLH
jgi:hypothetical protein